MGCRDRENVLASVPRCFHSQTFQSKLAKEFSSFLWSARNLSQIFWLGICESYPSCLEAWSLMSSRAARVHDHSIQLISYPYSTVNNCFIFENNTVYVDHRHSRTDSSELHCVPKQNLSAWSSLWVLSRSSCI